jgi:hypothetical protein
VWWFGVCGSFSTRGVEAGETNMPFSNGRKTDAWLHRM